MGARVKATEWEPPEAFREELLTHQEALDQVKKIEQQRADRDQTLDIDDLGDFFRAFRYGKYASKAIKAVRAVAGKEGEQLATLLINHNIKWRKINYGYQFLFTNMALMSWWPSTGRMTWQPYSGANARSLRDYKTPSDFMSRSFGSLARDPYDTYDRALGDYDPMYEQQQDLKKRVVPLPEGMDGEGYTLIDPNTKCRYMECDSCGMICELEDYHSAGECNICHAVNKDD